MCIAKIDNLPNGYTGILTFIKKNDLEVKRKSEVKTNLKAEDVFDPLKFNLFARVKKSMKAKLIFCKFTSIKLR